ncbi:hypothetical protein HHL17_24745 [Chitinophaga sp. G-6-1-13]|uniref:Uncharacterized protein n=1 Tax=Chitinophaga fulva TaxID=2728842 RepID=A0A848GSW3_9BACT|nr:hypothetical protein [Chitinophaga fulva]NML40429.1 hypothetical protein [Chitinophaga fulva]
MKKAKKYDALAEVRKVRDELSVKYRNNPELLFRDLKAARERFHAEAEACAAAKQQLSIRAN